MDEVTFNALNKIQSATVEGDILIIAASGRVYSIEEYRMMVKLYSDEIVKSGLSKIIIDEREVEYSPSIMLQVEVVNFYSSGEVPEELAAWKVVGVCADDSISLFEFWAAFARSKGYDNWAFSSLDEAKSFMKNLASTDEDAF